MYVAAVNTLVAGLTDGCNSRQCVYSLVCCHSEVLTIIHCSEDYSQGSIYIYCSTMCVFRHDISCDYNVILVGMCLLHCV